MEHGPQVVEVESVKSSLALARILGANQQIPFTPKRCFFQVLQCLQLRPIILTFNACLSTSVREKSDSGT
jgi:hypothetical protein